MNNRIARISSLDVILKPKYHVLVLVLFGDVINTNNISILFVSRNKIAVIIHQIIVSPLLISIIDIEIA